MNKVRYRRLAISYLICIVLMVQGVLTYDARADEYREGDVIYLDPDTGDISDDTIRAWAGEAGLLEGTSDTEAVCTKMDLIRILWIRNCRPEYKAEALKTKIGDVDKKDLNAALWAYKNGIASVSADRKFNPGTELTAGDVLNTLWVVKGRPAISEEIEGFENLSSSASYYYAALWAADQKLLIKDEITYFNGAAKSRVIDALRFIYYQYHVRSTRTFPITRSEFVAAVQRVADEARVMGYHYGNSQGLPPTSDGIISCDRIVAKALWDLGFTDQNTGGFAGGTGMFEWLTAHGFIQSFDPGDIGYGSIVCTFNNELGHTFVTVSWDPSDYTVVKFDEGSESKICQVQPFTESWSGDDFNCVFNIPDE